MWLREKAGPPETYRRDAELIDEFKREMEGGDLVRMF